MNKRGIINLDSKTSHLPLSIGKLKDKRGLSAVVTNLIMILLVFVSVGIVWVVVQNVLVDTADQINLDTLTLDIEIKNVYLDDSGTNVVVTRNPGAGEITGLNIVLSSGQNSETIEFAGGIDELVTKTFTISTSQYDGLVKEIYIAPTLTTESGKVQIGKIKAQVKYSDEEAIEKMNGLVSWWKFENNANDEIGGNHGIPQGGVGYVEDGQRGNVVSLDRVGPSPSATPYSHILVSGPTTLNIPGKTLSIFAWIKRNLFVTNQYVLSNGADTSPAGGYGLYFTNADLLRSFIWTDTGGQKVLSSTTAITDTNWHHVGMVFDGTSLILYQDGFETGISTFSDTSLDFATTFPFRIGVLGSTAYWHGTNGLIDDTIVFDKALTAQQIEDLYNLQK